MRHAAPSTDFSRPPGEWELDPAGLQAVDRLAEHPEVAVADRFFTSPEPRALQTARRLNGESRRSLETVAELMELQRPAGYVADFTPVVARALLQPGEPALPDWETAESCRQRVLAGMAVIAIGHRGESLVVVSHGMALALFLAWFRGRREADPRDWQGMGLPDVAVLEWEDRKVLHDFGHWHHS